MTHGTTVTRLQWFVLLHSPGPAVVAGGSVFEHPGFGEHVDFLRRRLADGSLVAAGPLPDAAGEGMTVLRAASEADARRLAEEDDAAVRQGVLAVRVRPWAVQLTTLE
jgi:uncharacterized protein YciI